MVAERQGANAPQNGGLHMQKKNIGRLILSAALTAALALGALAGCSAFGGEGGDGGSEGGGDVLVPAPSEPTRPTLPDYGFPASPSALALPPQDGSTPEDYTALGNYAFAAGALALREAFHVESDSTANAVSLGIIKVEQKVRGTKDFRGGVLLTSTVSTSSMALAPSKAIQKYYGKGEVIVRAAASDEPEDWAADVVWADGEPAETLDEAAYEARYGLWGSELCDFIVTEDTVLSASDLQKEGENYALTFELCTEEGKDAAAGYKKQMVTMGELDEEPDFTVLRLTLRFAPDWTVLSLTTEEEYSSKKIMTAQVSGRTEISFSYDEADVDVSDYESYFRAWARG